MSTDTTLRAADAVFAAERAVGRARWVVEELQATIASALRVLDDAELDSAKAKLSDRASFYRAAAGEHLGRLQARCEDARHLINGVYGHLDLAADAADRVHSLLAEPDASDPRVAANLFRLRSRVAAVHEMVALAKPVARTAARHIDCAQHATQSVTPSALLEPVTRERSIATAGNELGRAEEDVRLLGNVVDHATASARESAAIASEITANARRRMSEQGRGPIPSASLPAPRSPRR
jgi:hypothetical protein